jgi:hypothetical protein
MATTFFHHLWANNYVYSTNGKMKTFVQVFATSDKNLFKTEKPLCLKLQTAGFKNIAIFG